MIVENRERDRRLGEAAIKIPPDDTLSVNRQQFTRAAAALLSAKPRPHASPRYRQQVGSSLWPRSTAKGWGPGLIPA